MDFRGLVGKASRTFAVTLVTVVMIAATSVDAGSAERSPATSRASSAAVQRSALCEGVKALRLPRVRVNVAQPVPAGTYYPPGGGEAFPHLPAFCRVTATVTRVPGSSVSMELWLPADGWNGRYMQVGTHGFGGVIHREEMAPQLRRGFATAATDSGHTAPAGVFDSTWAFESRQRVTDYAWRSVHETAVNAQRVIGSFYGQRAAYSYYVGSSTGGRDGMMSAQRFPRDFDGILAGNAIQNFTRSGTQMLVASKRLAEAGFKGEEGAELLGLVRRKAIAACDGEDGVTDGIIRDPRTCDWSPRSLACQAGQEKGTCLSTAQADAVAEITAPLLDPVTNQRLYVGQAISSQIDWLDLIPTSEFSNALYQMGLNDPDWDGSSFSLHTDFTAVEDALGFVNATNPDLRAFRAAGGKLIQYQNWEDGVVSPESTVEYYNSVLSRTARGDRSELGNFYRLFMVPGRSHKGLGSGPDNFGQDVAPPVSRDAEHDAVTALRDWVEKGRAPGKFIATKSEADGDVTMQRPVCPYPMKAVYAGAGNPNVAGNFACG
ncbi:tannase/feruloyl esterase family alpha/beta hydrolase [Streptomyces sp. NPDC049954]|uniref:tannase/feruloyl esterase family alpha/beta hydrolase n=1 Tax=Streptomyces sp. NPDC049954 TaxID=3155779 RepID=UPI003429D8F8